MIRKILIGAGLLAAVGAAGVGITAWWVDGAMNSPHEHAKANDYITIEKGTAPAAVIGRLVSEGVIADGTPVMLYLRTVGDASKIKAGDYRFKSPITPLEVLSDLEKGEERTKRLVIPEGFTKFDITQRVAEFTGVASPRLIPELWERKSDNAATFWLTDDTRLIKELFPEAESVEGYMYPATYDISPNEPASEIIQKMVRQFLKVWKPEWTEKAKSMGRTPHEIVTIASLIETETGVPAERPIVASVIYNRLAKRIPLGIDQTNVYIAKMEGRWDGTINKSDLEVNSPYNTRKFAGLPPGPISSVSESAIEAALNPAQTDYIYYVRNVQANDGSHWFYASAADFERGKAEYQRWLEKERQEKRANETNNSNVQQ